MTKRRRNALPPLPGRYRTPATEGESYGFRMGAFLLSLAFLLIGLGLAFSPDGAVEGWAVPVGIGFVAVFTVSAVFSRGWSDRPVSGVHRVLAELQFVVMGAFASVVVIGAGFMIAKGLWLVLVSSPLLLLPFVLLLAFLVFLTRRWHVAELMGARIGSRHVADIAQTAVQRSDINKGTGSLL